MAIGLRGAGALATTTTNSLTFTLPAGTAAGDLIIVHIGAGEDNPEPAYVSGMTGYALRGNKLFLDYGPGGISQWIYWKVAGASEPNPSITINDGGGGLWGYAMAFTGVNQSDPFDLASVSQSVESLSSATFTPPSVETQTDGSWVISLVQTSDDNTTAMSVAQSFTHIASGASYETTVGLDASFASAYRLISTAGTVTLPTWNQVNRSPDYWAWQTIALKDASAGTKVTDSFTADARKLAPSGTKTFTASAVILRPSGTKTFTADAATQLHTEDTFTADAVRKATIEGSATADAVRQATSSGSFTADAIRLETVEFDPAATIDAAIAGTVSTVSDSFTADALRSLTGRCVWTSPANGAGISPNPDLQFLMPSSTGNMWFWMELDTVDTFDSPNLRTIKTTTSQTDWSYWDGGGWQAVPSDGVPNTYSGNEARYSVTNPLTAGTWYRRVRAGTQ
jgi:hypothetical protein